MSKKTERGFETLAKLSAGTASTDEAFKALFAEHVALKAAAGRAKTKRELMKEYGASRRQVEWILTRAIAAGTVRQVRKMIAGAGGRIVSVTAYVAVGKAKAGKEAT